MAAARLGNGAAAVRFLGGSRGRKFGLSGEDFQPAEVAKSGRKSAQSHPNRLFRFGFRRTRKRGDDGGRNDHCYKSKADKNVMHGVCSSVGLLYNLSHLDSAKGFAVTKYHDCPILRGEVGCRIPPTRHIGLAAVLRPLRQATLPVRAITHRPALSLMRDWMSV